MQVTFDGCFVLGSVAIFVLPSAIVVLNCDWLLLVVIMVVIFVTAYLFYVSVTNRPVIVSQEVNYYCDILQTRMQTMRLVLLLCVSCTNSVYQCINVSVYLLSLYQYISVSMYQCIIVSMSWLLLLVMLLSFLSILFNQPHFCRSPHVRPGRPELAKRRTLGSCWCMIFTG